MRKNYLHTNALFIKLLKFVNLLMARSSSGAYCGLASEGVQYPLSVVTKCFAGAVRANHNAVGRLLLRHFALERKGVRTRH